MSKKKGIIVYGYLRRLLIGTNIEPKRVCELVLAYYRNPLLRQLIFDALKKKYNIEIVKYFNEYCRENNSDCKTLFKDITCSSMKCNVIDYFDKLELKQNLLELHQLFRTICVGSSKHFKQHCFIIDDLRKFITCYTNNDGSVGEKMDFNLHVNGIDDDKKLETVVFIYTFGYYWLYQINRVQNRRNKGRNKNCRCKADVLVNASIQYLFKDIDVLLIPMDISKKLIEHEDVKQSAYFVRNILNQYLKNTFIPFVTE